jgi:prophage regulatory protein
MGARRVLRRVPSKAREVPGAVRAAPAEIQELAIDPRQVVLGERLLPLPAVQAKVGALSKSTLWKLVKTREFPAPIRITANRVGWLESEVDAWIARLRLRARP